MSIPIGFDHYTIAHRGLSAAETLEFARGHGLDGVQFLEPAVIDNQLDPGRLAEFRKSADAMGLYLEVGLPSPNPVRRSRELGRDVTVREQVEFLGPHLEAVVALGCRHARTFIGDRHDRFLAAIPWSFQRGVTHEVLSLLTPRLRELGVKIAVENHADLTSGELLNLLDRLEPDAFGIAFDTGNLLMRLDDPVEAAARFAPRVLSTHVKDAVLATTTRGLCWQARPVGLGILPMPDLLAPVLRANPQVTLSIELHPRIYDLPINDPNWLAYFPDLRPEALASIVSLAACCEGRYESGEVPRPDVVEAIPWADRDLDWLASSLGYLRSVVPMLSRL